MASYAAQHARERITEPAMSSKTVLVITLAVAALALAAVWFWFSDFILCCAPPSPR